MIELKLIEPVDAPINERAGKYGDPRANGRTHRGIDYLATKGSMVRACEDGVIVRASEHPTREVEAIGKNGKKEKKFIGSYGNVVIIDHTPRPDANARHIYTLYAHLDAFYFFSPGHMVKKGLMIGRSGNTGTKEDYKGWNSGYHLHFEVIDAPRKLVLQTTGATGVESGMYRENPGSYLNRTTTIPFTEKEIDEIRKKVGADIRFGNMADRMLGKSSGNIKSFIDLKDFLESSPFR